MSEKEKLKPSIEVKGGKTKKKEYEKVFNEIFGTSIKWSKLSIEDLTQLATVLTNPEPLIRKLGGIPASEVGTTTLIEILKRIMSEYEGPLVKLVRKYLWEEKKK